LLNKATVALAADHRGFEMKEKIKTLLEDHDYKVLDFGTNSEESCDYPDYMIKAATAVNQGKAKWAIGVCHSGIGSAIAANKVKGVRAALVANAEQAELSRAHNNSNMLILGSGFIKSSEVKKIVNTWLETPFEGGRHARRISKITRYEKQHSLK